MQKLTKKRTYKRTKNEAKTNQNRAENKLKADSLKTIVFFVLFSFFLLG